MWKLSLDVENEPPVKIERPVKIEPPVKNEYFFRNVSMRIIVASLLNSNVC